MRKLFEIRKCYSEPLKSNKICVTVMNYYLPTQEADLGGGPRGLGPPLFSEKNLVDYIGKH